MLFRSPTVWRDTAQTLMNLSVDENGQRRAGFEDIEWFDLGGGLGVAGQNPKAKAGVHLPSVAAALKGTAEKPVKRDPKGTHRLCKHAYAVLRDLFGVEK